MIKYPYNLQFHVSFHQLDIIRILRHYKLIVLYPCQVPSLLAFNGLMEAKKSLFTLFLTDFRLLFDTFKQIHYICQLTYWLLLHYIAIVSICKL